MANTEQTKSSAPPQIADHTLLRRIGDGAYGEVWLARSVTGAFRAVKVVSRDRFREDRPFNREFEGIQKYEPLSRSHPGLVAVLHVGRNEQDKYFFYVMELADDVSAGQEISHETYEPKTLASEIRRRTPIPVAECFDWGIALADALRYLHHKQNIPRHQTLQYHLRERPAKVCGCRARHHYRRTGFVRRHGRVFAAGRADKSRLGYFQFRQSAL